MSFPAGWIAVAAVLALLLGLSLMLAGRGMRQRRGLGGGKTVSLDRVTLTSRRLGLTGRPDRLIKTDGTIIVEEWKSARTLRPWHRAQLGCYFLLIEEELRIRPSHGVIVCGDGTRHQVENDAELRAWVIDLAGQIRAARAKVTAPIPVNPKPGQCRPCGMRGNCGQARL
jgi:CRISPR-associated exonuclease Cas4